MFACCKDFCRPLCQTILFCGMLLAGNLLTGCSGGPHSEKPSGSVTAKVTYGGQPVTVGTVTLFSSQTGLGGGQDLNQEGVAYIETIPVGEYVVTVTPPLPDMSDPNPPQIDYPQLPQKFRSDTTSTLKATVTEGDNDLQLELKES